MDQQKPLRLSAAVNITLPNGEVSKQKKLAGSDKMSEMQQEVVRRRQEREAARAERERLLREKKLQAAAVTSEVLSTWDPTGKPASSICQPRTAASSRRISSSENKGNSQAFRPAISTQSTGGSRPKAERLSVGSKQAEPPQPAEQGRIGSAALQLVDKGRKAQLTGKIQMPCRPVGGAEPRNNQLGLQTARVEPSAGTHIGEEARQQLDASCTYKAGQAARANAPRVHQMHNSPHRQPVVSKPPPRVPTCPTVSRKDEDGIRRLTGRLPIHAAVHHDDVSTATPRTAQACTSSVVGNDAQAAVEERYAALFAGHCKMLQMKWVNCTLDSMLAGPAYEGQPLMAHQLPVSSTQTPGCVEEEVRQVEQVVQFCMEKLDTTDAQLTKFEEHLTAERSTAGGLDSEREEDIAKALQRIRAVQRQVLHARSVLDHWRRLSRAKVKHVS